MSDRPLRSRTPRPPRAARAAGCARLPRRHRPADRPHAAAARLDLPRKVAPRVCHHEPCARRPTCPLAGRGPRRTPPPRPRRWPRARRGLPAACAGTVRAGRQRPRRVSRRAVTSSRSTPRRVSRRAIVTGAHHRRGPQVLARWHPASHSSRTTGTGLGGLSSPTPTGSNQVVVSMAPLIGGALFDLVAGWSIDRRRDRRQRRHRVALDRRHRCRHHPEGRRCRHRLRRGPVAPAGRTRS